MARVAARFPQEGEDPVRLDRVAALTGYRLRRATGVFQSDLAETLKPYDLRMITFTALTVIVDNSGLNQARLAEALEIERPNLVAIIDGLERAGLITRERVPTDRRAYALVATEAGQEVQTRAMQAVLAHERRLLGGLDEETVETVMRAMQVILHQPGREET